MRKGSALLIVLGIASFLTVSAVSFAIYMRESRVPSSQLRRQVTTRYLLKSALANAIDQIDRAIGDDPYPGVGPNADKTDRWTNRVFMPQFNVAYHDPVPVLTLEALAYLPPAIINDVRVLASQSEAADWQVLTYEFGRYAYCAVHVSDCLDVNRITASQRRTTAPGERVSVASLFRQADGMVDEALTKELDTIVKKAGNIPFISMADFNVVAGKSSFSPFCNYIGTSGMHLGDDGNDLAVSNALFITDTWFPPTNRTASTSKKYDLTADQPFKDFSDEATLDTVMKETSPLYKDLRKYIGAFGVAALYDYLDADQKPLSFCIPTVEAVPMVVGVGLVGGSEIRPRFSEGNEIKGTVGGAGMGQKKTERTATLVKFDGVADGPVQLRGTAIFPFRRLVSKKYKTSFTGDALVKLWWAPRGTPGRLGVCDDGSGSDPLMWPTADDWGSSGVSAKNGIITAHESFDSFNLSVKDEPTVEEAMADFLLPLDLSSVSGLPVCWHIVDRVLDKNGQEQSKEEYLTLDGLKIGETIDAMFAPYEVNCLNPAAYWRKAPVVKEGPSAAGGAFKPETLNRVGTGTSLDGEAYVMHLAVWVRILNDAGEVVDIVPARLEDDHQFGLGGAAEELMDPLKEIVGGGQPILEFRGQTEMKMNVEELLRMTEKEVAPFAAYDALFCNDPRYNWAPENWFTANTSGKGATKQAWLDAVKGLFEKDERDADPFFFTSDQETLQSAGELAFLPYVGWGGGLIETHSDAFGSFNGKCDDASGAGHGPCANLFWKTYSAIGNIDPIYTFDGKFEIVSGEGHGFMVNPFSRDPRILTLAVADTPMDFYITATNGAENANGKLDVKTLKTPQDAEPYLFDFSMEDEQQVVAGLKEMMGDASTANNGDWASVFGNENYWQSGGTLDDQYNLFGQKLSVPLYGVDRKFLYAFWRECFQNRQQLFLIFLRAEPLSVGGVSGDAIANAQLGARGVALVWRDPAPPPNKFGGGNNAPPHRTRVLFYHQFD